MNGCRTLADVICRAAGDSVADDVLAKARCCLLDFATCTILGSRDPIGEAIVSYVLSSDPGNESTIVGADVRAGAGGAALANGTLAHALDFDDVSFAIPGHPSAPVFAAALAVAEPERSSGERVLLAAVLGIETQCELGRIMNPALSRTGWHPTGVLGTLGATAACGVLLGLDRERLAHALGVACSLACGVKANFGSMTKPLHVGVAARNGVMAAQLARGGWTAGPDALGGQFSLLDSLGAATGIDRLGESFGEPYEVLSPGIRFKRYPSCAGTHGAIDAMADLVAEHDLHPRHVRGIRCSVTPFVRRVAITDEPATGLEGKFSIPFCLAVYLLNRNVSPEHFKDDVAGSPTVQALITKIEIVESAALSADGFSGCATLLEVALEDGRTLTARSDADAQEQSRPISEAELIAKYRRCVEPLLGNDRTERILQAIQIFARAEQIGQVMALLGSRGTGANE